MPPMLMQSGMQPVQYYASVSIELIQTAVNSLQNSRESPFEAPNVQCCTCFECGAQTSEVFQVLTTEQELLDWSETLFNNLAHFSCALFDIAVTRCHLFW